MKIFQRKIEVKVSKLDTDERILYLANRLYDEIKASGRELQVSSSDMHSVNVFVHQSDKPQIEIENMCAKGGGWKVKGARG